MRNKEKQETLVSGETSVDALDERQQQLLQRLGLHALPTATTDFINPAQIMVPGRDLIRPSSSLRLGIKRVGILQAPSVVQRPCQEGEPITYEVIVGRRRVMCAQLERIPRIKCEIYSGTVTPQLKSILTLMENTQRSSAWIKEIEELYLLSTEQVGLTTEELADFGFDKRSFAFYRQIIQCPVSIVTEILAGRVTQTTARRIARMSPSGQRELASQIERGEPLTAELVEELVNGHIATAMTPLQHALPSGNGDIPASAGATPDLTAVQALIDHLSQFEEANPTLEPALQGLIRLLANKLRAAQHDHPSQFHPTQSVTQSEA